MIYIVPIMGHGTVGKDHVVETFCDGPFAMYTLSDVRYYDTSEHAKELLHKISLDQMSNARLQESEFDKDVRFRTALINIIDAFDALDIRLYDTLNAIDDLLKSHFRKRNAHLDNNHYDCKNLIIFLNIRDAAFVERLADNLLPRGYKVHAMVVIDGDNRERAYENTRLDSEEYEKSLIRSLYDIQIPYYVFSNDNKESADYKNNLYKQQADFFKALTGEETIIQ